VEDDFGNDDDFDFDSMNMQSNETAYDAKTKYFLNDLNNLFRENDKPVGLKNVGNTCWFNSIVQAFFHLPYFRNLILSFKIDESNLNKLNENVF
jgi:ubiquitin C-terminal hydrolase